MGGSKRFDPNYVIDGVMKAPSVSPETRSALNELGEFITKAAEGVDGAVAKFFAVSEATMREIGVDTIGGLDLHNYVGDVLASEYDWR
jgi:hypothetical protein